MLAIFIEPPVTTVENDEFDEHGRSVLLLTTKAGRRVQPGTMICRLCLVYLHSWQSLQATSNLREQVSTFLTFGLFEYISNERNHELTSSKFFDRRTYLY